MSITCKKKGNGTRLYDQLQNQQVGSDVAVVSVVMRAVGYQRAAWVTSGLGGRSINVVPALGPGVLQRLSPAIALSVVCSHSRYANLANISSRTAGTSWRTFKWVGVPSDQVTERGYSEEGGRAMLRGRWEVEGAWL
jgi:hypothetical protein